MNNQTKEIMWNVVNSVLAGALVFFGAAVSELNNHGLSSEALPELMTGLVLGGLTSAVIAVTKFKDYWAKEESEYKGNLSKAFNFI